jgi:chaperone BCS1
MSSKNYTVGVTTTVNGKLEDIVMRAVSYQIEKTYKSNINDVTLHSKADRYMTHDSVSSNDIIKDMLYIIDVDQRHVKIKYNKNNITIYKKNTDNNSKKKSKTFETKKYIFLSSVSKEHIYSFINESIEQYHLSEKSKREPLLYEISASTQMYENYSEWQSVKSNINKSFSNIFLEKNLESSLKKYIETFENSEDSYIKKGIPYKKGFMFHGFPGNGKTSICHALKNEFNRNLYLLTIDNNLSKENIIDLIRNVNKNSILLIDDVDIFLKQLNRKSKEKDSSDNCKKSPIDLSTILSILDGYTFLNDVIVIMTTNELDSIDKAIIRPGRIDHVLFFGNASLYILKNIYKFYLGISLPEKISDHFKNNENNIGKTSGYIINTVILPNTEDVESINKLLLSF